MLNQRTNRAKQIPLCPGDSKPLLCLSLQLFLRNKSIHTALPLEFCSLLPPQWNPVTSTSIRAGAERGREGGRTRAAGAERDQDVLLGSHKLLERLTLATDSPLMSPSLNTA